MQLSSKTFGGSSRRHRWLLKKAFCHLRFLCPMQLLFLACVQNVLCSQAFSLTSLSSCPGPLLPETLPGVLTFSHPPSLNPRVTLCLASACFCISLVHTFFFFLDLDGNDRNCCLTFNFLFCLLNEFKFSLCILCTPHCPAWCQCRGHFERRFQLKPKKVVVLESFPWLEVGELHEWTSPII